MSIRLACVAALITLLECAAIPLARAETPDATLEFSTGSPAAGVGYTWASGTLSYGGESHPFRVNGLGVVDMDVSIEAIGIVHRLARLQDFDGTYTEVEVDAELAGEGYTGALENQHGVVIGLRSPIIGMQFNPSLIGVSIELEPGSR
jgi:hypothetical protein